PRAHHRGVDSRHRVRDARILLLALRGARLAPHLAGHARPDGADDLLRPPGHRLHAPGRARTARELPPMVALLARERRADHRVRRAGLRLAGDQGPLQGLVLLEPRRHIAPAARRRWRAAASEPSSARTSALCWPRSGAARSTAPGVAERRPGTAGALM